MGFIFYGGLSPETLFQPLPIWAVTIALFLMPISIAAVETPLYIGYSLPRLQLLLNRDKPPVHTGGFD
ncbi:hypothetical protein [Pseudogracilibacillus sp. SO30301A]|uniref:hypothetical protein n=1 Tax=Pseudogracilibacillus sp. SO30301A TaxID=3098291 RepID=UPI00300E6C6D